MTDKEMEAWAYKIDIAKAKNYVGYLSVIAYQLLTECCKLGYRLEHPSLLPNDDLTKYSDKRIKHLRVLELNKNEDYSVNKSQDADIVIRNGIVLKNRGGPASLVNGK